jgi:transposase
MKRFVEGEDRTQGVLLPEFLEDYVAEDNPVRAIDVFVDELDLRGLGFEGVVAETTGRPAYLPPTQWCSEALARVRAYSAVWMSAGRSPSASAFVT